jgi:hypothetical protein
MRVKATGDSRPVLTERPNSLAPPSAALSGSEAGDIGHVLPAQQACLDVLHALLEVGERLVEVLRSGATLSVLTLRSRPRRRPR